MTVGSVTSVSILAALAARGTQIIVTSIFPIEATAGTAAAATAAGTARADAAGCAAEATGTTAATGGNTPVKISIPYLTLAAGATRATT